MSLAAERTRIFKAAMSCFSRYGLRRTTMDDVAAAAGVSRKTVYNYFTNKSALIAEVIFEEARKVNARARKGLDLELPAADLVVEAALALLTSAKKSGYIEILLNPVDFGTAAEVIDHSDRIAAVMHEYWDPILNALVERGELPAELDHHDLVAWLTFIHVGLCARPSATSDRDQARRWLERYVVTGILGVSFTGSMTREIR
jgi:AcrR family transcriptional regulator